MNIAIVGGGTRCLRLIELIENYAFQELSPKVVAVADIKPDAVGLIRAREKGLSVTHDYNDFFDRDDLELIMELTGDADVFDGHLQVFASNKTRRHRGPVKGCKNPGQQVLVLAGCLKSLGFGLAGS